MEIFEPHGFHQEYFIGDKYLGIRKMPSSFTASYGTGYASRMEYTARQDIKVGKSCIRKGQRYWTMITPICGKYVGGKIAEIKRDVQQSILNG